MTPRILIIRDRKTRRIEIVRLPSTKGPVPPLVNPVRPCEPKDELSREDQEIRKRPPA
jgi:hypothetical protein